MKNLFKSLMLVAVAAMAFTACSQDNNELNNLTKKTVFNFQANIGEDTRSGFMEKEEGATSYKSEWYEGDKVKIFIDGHEPIVADIDTEGNFSFELEGEVPETFFMSVCAPADSWEDLNTCNIPYSQEPLANTVDPRAHLLSAKYVPVTNGAADITMIHNDAAYAKMTLDLPEDFNVESVEVMFEGVWFDENITRRYEVSAENVVNNTFWFACDPMTVSKFSVVASEPYDYDLEYDYNYERKSMSKTVDVAAAGKELEFAFGRVATFSVSGLTMPLNTIYAETTVNENAITFEWEEVENAVSYTVYLKEELGYNQELYMTEYGPESSYTTTELTYTVSDLKYNTEYDYAVVANPAEDSKIYAASEKMFRDVRTGIDPNNFDYEFTFDKFVSFEDNTLVLSNASGHTWNTIMNPGLTSIVEGTYTPVQPDWDNGGIIPYTSADALEYDGFNSYIYTDSKFYFCNDIVVTVDDGVYTIVMKGLAYLNGGNKTYKATFTGSFGGSEEPETPEYKTITAFNYLGRSYDFDSNPETNGGDYVYSVKSEDFDFTIGLYWSYANEDGTIKDGTYNYCYNALNTMYTGWEGFVIVDDTYHYNSTLTVSGSKITLTLYTDYNLVGVYVYDGSNGGGVEPEPEPETIELTITSHGLGYSGSMEQEIIFLESAEKQHLIDFRMTGIQAGSYTDEDGSILINYSKFMYGNADYGSGIVMSAAEAVITDNGNGTFTFDVTFIANGTTYHFIYTTQAEEPEEPEVDAIQLTAKGAFYTIGSSYRLQKMSDDSGNNKVTLAVHQDALTNGLVAAGNYSWYSSPGGIYYQSEFSFVNNETYVNGAKYANNSISNASMSVDAVGVVTLKFTAGGENVTFVCAPYVEPETLATPVVTATVNGNSITASWNAVTGAGSYVVKLNGVEKDTVTTTSYTFENLDYSTEYTISVVAKAANTTTHKDSAAGSVTKTTEADPNAGGNEGGDWVFDVTTEGSVNTRYTYFKFMDSSTSITGGFVYPSKAFIPGEYKVNSDSIRNLDATNYVISDIKLNGVYVNSASGTVSIVMNGDGSYTFSLDLVVNGVSYKGSKVWAM